MLGFYRAFIRDCTGLLAVNEIKKPLWSLTLALVPAFDSTFGQSFGAVVSLFNFFTLAGLCKESIISVRGGMGGGGPY